MIFLLRASSKDPDNFDLPGAGKALKSLFVLLINVEGDWKRKKLCSILSRQTLQAGDDSKMEYRSRTDGVVGDIKID